MNSFAQSSRSLTPNALNRTAARAASGRLTPASRRLQSTDVLASYSRQSSPSPQASRLRPIALRSPFLPHEIRPLIPSTQSRSFHVTSSPWQQQAEKKPEAEAGAKPEEETAKTTEDGKTKEDAASEEQQKRSEEGEGEQQKSEGQGQENKKQDAPPPPPHGDKTPWQVFMETMQTEFKASKEWNESTKALSGEIQTFQESERVRKAREAYQSTTGAISSSTSSAVRATAGAIGKGAAWTWDTGAMKGVRKAANVTGGALDKATQPIRNTEAYKNVKNVIDDGSSSRYGGWVEKEERRKRREAEQSGKGADPANFEEDPK